MKPVNKKYLTIAASIWLAFFVLLFIFHLAVLVPQKNYIKKIEKQIEEKKRTFYLALEVGDYENKLKLDREIEQLRSELDTFVNTFQDLSNLTLNIRQIAGKEQLDSFSIKTQGNYQGLAIPYCNYICESRISTSFLAEFNQFANFINSLERHKPVVFVDTFVIKRGNEQDPGNKAKVSLSVFVKKPQDT